MHRFLAPALALLFLLGQTPVAGQSVSTVRVIGPGNDGYTAVWVGVKLGIFKKLPRH